MAGELITADYQIEWRGVVLGTGSAFGTGEITGLWDLPGQRGSNAALPSNHGSFPGRKLSAERYPTWSFKTKTPRANFAAAVDQLRRVTAPDEDPQEEPLVISIDGQSWLVWARVHRRNIPTGRRYAVGYAEGSVQWETTDPRIYSPVEHSLPTVLATPNPGGLDFGSGGLNFGSGGLDFGGGQQNGVVAATNAGHVPTWPTFEIVGPCTGPTITCNGRVLRFSSTFVVLSGQTVVIDTRPTWRTVQIAGVSVRHQLIVDQWAPLQPGANQVFFTAAAYDAASQLVVRWRDAWH